MQEYIKHLLIRTPVEKPLEDIRWLLKFRQRLKHPELNEIYIEDKRIKQMMNQVINKSSNCLDIGCHLGSMLSEIMTLAPQGNHIAVEALPYKTNLLKKKFPEVDIKQLALGEKTGEVTFYLNTSRSGYSGLFPHNKQGDKIQEVTVKCEKLDNILFPEYQVDFIKIDVEGAELSVFRGGENMLRRYRPTILFEFARSAFSKYDVTPSMMFEFLTEKHNYSIFLIKDFLENVKPLSFEEFGSALKYPFKAFNFIASAR
ncbi:MAG: FkbM family methyltransferase [Microcoleaceae cyanobacterium]